MYPITHLTTSERADVHARARRLAAFYRREAVDQFWGRAPRSIGLLVRALGAAVIQSVKRGQQRLARGVRRPAAV